MAAAAVPQGQLNETGAGRGRKLLNSVLRLRRYAGVAPMDVAPGCAAAVHPHPPQGTARLEDALRCEAWGPED